MTLESIALGGHPRGYPGACTEWRELSHQEASYGDFSRYLDFTSQDTDGVRQETLSPSVLETGERVVFHLVFSPIYQKVCVKDSGKRHFAIFS